MGRTRANGTAGGILVLWDRRVVQKRGFWRGSHSVSCHFQNVEDGFDWLFIGVYGPNAGRGDNFGLT